MQIRKLINQSLLIAFLFGAFSFASCSGGEENGTSQSEETSATDPEENVVPVDPMENKGIGPVKNVELGPIDESLAKKGQEIFESKCAACHKMDQRYVGPPLKGITERRTPEWIMNMILNSVEMTQKDPIAKDLLAEYLTQMTFQNLSEDDARAVLEYFRLQDSQK